MSRAVPHAGEVVVIASPYDGERLRRLIEQSGRPVRVVDGGPNTEAALSNGRTPVILSLRLARGDARVWLDRLRGAGTPLVVVADPQERAPEGVEQVGRPIDAARIEEALRRVGAAPPGGERRPPTRPYRAVTPPAEPAPTPGLTRRPATAPWPLRERAKPAGSSTFRGGAPPPASPASPASIVSPISPMSPISIDEMDLDALDAPALRGMHDVTPPPAPAGVARPPAGSDAAARSPELPEPPDEPPEPAIPAARATRPLPAVGDLRTHDFPTLLGHLYREGFSGRLRVRRGDIEKTLWLDDGFPVSTASNLPADRLADQLLREGAISRAQYDEATRRSAETGRRVGALLLEMGALAAPALVSALRRHHEAILSSLFGWDDATFELDVDQPPASDRLRLDTHPAALVLAGVRRKFGPDRLIERLGTAWTVLERVGEDPPDAMGLKPAERSAIGWFDGRATLEEVAERSGLGRVGVLAVAWALLALGYLRRATEDGRDSAPRPDRVRVTALYALARTADYFTLLGLPRDADAAAVRRAHEFLKAAFDPAGLGPFGAEMSVEIEEIRETIDEARLVLEDDGRRDAYRRAIEEAAG